MVNLKEEKIVVTLKGKHQRHEYQGGDVFVNGMSKLMVYISSFKVEVTTDVKPKDPVKGNASSTERSTGSSRPQLKSA